MALVWKTAGEKWLGEFRPVLGGFCRWRLASADGFWLPAASRRNAAVRYQSQGNILLRQFEIRLDWVR